MALSLSEDSEVRKDIITKMQRVYTLMKDDFTATNVLVKFLNENVSPSPNIAEIAINNDATFRENLNTMIKTMDQIEEERLNIILDLSKKLDRDLYERLTDEREEFESKIKFINTARESDEPDEADSSEDALTKTIHSYLFISEILASGRFSDVSCSAEEVAVAHFAREAAGLFVSGSANIEVTLETSELSDTIDELNEMLDEFEEPSECYSRVVLEVREKLDAILN